MVCKDKATIALLEVSEEIKKRYEQQSSAVSISFLMSGLNIGNQCDLYYKGSKNQRLHVELALMKMAFINQAITATDLLEDLKKKVD